MGWRQMMKRGRYPFYVAYAMIWNTRHIGRFWKRQLSKSRRRGWKQGRDYRGEKDGIYRGQARYESECNYKSW